MGNFDDEFGDLSGYKILSFEEVTKDLKEIKIFFPVPSEVLITILVIRTMSILTLPYYWVISKQPMEAME